MVRLSGNMATNAGVAICGGTAIYFPTSVSATESTAAGCGTADTTNSSGVFQCLTLSANKYDIRVNCGSAFRWFRYADEIQHATYQTGDGCACGTEGNFYFGIGNDFGIRWSTADASNHAAVMGIGDTSQQMHITDAAAMNTDWARCAGTHPELAIHSNTTPASDYLAIGNHDGTTATVDVVGGTTLNLDISGTTEGHIDADGVCVITGNFYSINNTSVLNATTLGSGVVNSSLTSVGTLTGATLSGDLVLQDDVDLALGTGSDILVRLSTANGHACSACEDAVIALSDCDQSLHITDAAAVATNWNIPGTTHPNVYIHSNTTPATDYLRLGGHTGTTASIDVVGGTTLALEIAGNTELTVTSAGLNVPANSDILFTGTTGTNDINLVDSVADALSIVRGSTDVIVFDTCTPRVTITPVTTITGLITATGGVTLPANADIAMTGTTGTNDIVLTNALADALSVTDGSADILVIDTNTTGNLWTLSSALHVEGAFVFNEGSADLDARFEGANNANLVTLDGGTDSLGFGSAVVAGAFMDIEPGAQDRDMVTAVGMAINLEADSTQINACGNCATIAVGAAIHLGTQTYTSTATGLTVTDLSVLHIVGEPVDSTNVTGTRKYSALIETGSLGLGIPGGSGATLKFGGSTSGIVTVQVPAAPCTYTWTLPPNNGGASQFLQTDGCGVTIWAAQTGLVAASVAEMEAGCSVAVATTPGRQQRHVSAAKAWVNITATGTESCPSYNITSVGDCCTGVHLITFATDFSNALYVGASAALARGAETVPNFDSILAGSIRLVVMDMTDGVGQVDEVAGQVFFGDQ